MSNKEFGDVNTYYIKYYRKIIGKNSTGVLSLLWKYPHKLMEKPFKSNKGFSVLELGYGEGEHFQFVQKDFEEYVALDRDEERLMMISNKADYRLLKKVGDAQLLDFPDETFDRVIATCLLAHLDDPDHALEEWCRVLKKGGSLSVYIPCDPGISLRIFRKFITKPKAEKHGFAGYNLYIARDHKNDAHRLLLFVKMLRGSYSVKIAYRPFAFVPSWYLNLFCLVRITKR